MKQKLLLHCCCAPCATSVVEKLMNDYSVALLYYNPNIRPKDEHDRRLSELKKFADMLKFPLVQIDFNSCKKDFDTIYGGRENMKEKSERCYLCYELRLKYARDFAKEHGFNLFCTTLSVSPFKNAKWINEIGKRLSGENTNFLESDFKKNSGFQRSVELSKKYGMQRQNYCGCTPII